MDKDNYIVTFPPGYHLEANKLFCSLKGQDSRTFLSDLYSKVFCTVFVGSYARNRVATTCSDVRFESVVKYCQIYKGGATPILYGGKE